jgi:hypothetical protein
MACIVGVAVASVIIAGGCGSGDDGSDARLTKAALIAQGDKICQEADGKRLAALAPYIKKAKEGELPPKADQERLVVELVLPPFQEEAEELAELNPPKQDEQKLQALVKEIEAAVKRGEANPVSILAGAETQFGKAEELGQEYGFKHCGRS